MDWARAGAREECVPRKTNELKMGGFLEAGGGLADFRETCFFFVLGGGEGGEGGWVCNLKLLLSIA